MIRPLRFIVLACVLVLLCQDKQEFTITVTA